MWRRHFVVLREEPAEGKLRQLADGYRLFQESRTGLYFLAAYGNRPGGRPDFDGFLDCAISHRLDLAALRQFLSDPPGSLEILRHDVNFDLIHRAASLSRQLDLAVLAIEETDDDYAMAAMVQDGTLDYLRFRTSRRDGTPVDIVGRTAEGFAVTPASMDETHAFALAAMADAFAVAGLRPFNFAEEKPSPEQARSDAARLGLPLKAYLDSFGLFRRVSEAPPRLTPADRIAIPLRRGLSLLALPFILTGLLAVALLYSGRPGADPGSEPWRLFLIGLGVLAAPLAGALVALRTMFG